jgi:hypothetical protein
MKVIGKGHDQMYICEVTHREIEKFMGLYYNNMNKLGIGDEINLGRGYDYLTETKEALKKTEDFIKSNKKVVEAILNGINLMQREP